MAPFRAPAFARPEGDPAPLPYLDAATDQAEGGIDLNLDAYLSTPRMHDAGVPRPPLPHQLRAYVLDRCSNAHAPHEQRLQPAPRGLVRQRHHVWPASTRTAPVYQK